MQEKERTYPGRKMVGSKRGLMSGWNLDDMGQSDNSSDLTAIILK